MVNVHGELDARFSGPDAKPLDWAQAREALVDAQIYWISTVRYDGQPHVTPVLAVWYEESLYFCTGEREQKAHNLTSNPQVALTTGSNQLDTGLDLVVEGVAVTVHDEARLKRLAEAWEAKYGEEWRFEIRDGAFYTPEGGRALVYEVSPVKVFGFTRGGYSQTRWRFDR